jgi:hypothetical protein
MKTSIEKLKYSKIIKKLLYLHLCLGLLFSIATPALAQQYPFRLRGSKVNNYWQEVTNNQWNQMLPDTWIDNGFHFYSRVRKRGPELGINTPSDLESEILKGTVQADGGNVENRYAIVLPIQNSNGDNLRVVYDYDQQRQRCKLVTLTF